MAAKNNISLATLQNHHISLFIMVESNCLVLMLIQREDENNDYFNFVCTICTHALVFCENGEQFPRSPVLSIYKHTFITKILL